MWSSAESEGLLPQISHLPVARSRTFILSLGLMVSRVLMLRTALPGKPALAAI